MVTYKVTIKKIDKKKLSKGKKAIIVRKKKTIPSKTKAKWLYK